ncbi:MAG: hypothetical protein F4125_04745 [Acidimicrobiaceae bacterium]|nr:hypothetical protein [Acidimicrobiaceae bacterium]
MAIRCGFVAEDRRSDLLEIEIDAPRGFGRDPERPDIFTGRLEAGQEVVFEYSCEPYEPDWTVELTVDADFVSAGAEQRSGFTRRDP